VEADVVDVISGGDAANAIESGGYVSITSQHGSCPCCELGRADWLKWAKCDAAQLRNDFRDLILKHEDPDAVHGREVVPPLPGQAKEPYKCLATGCNFVLTAENIAASKARYEAMTPAKRHRLERIHANGRRQQGKLVSPSHFGNLPHKLPVYRMDANK
jgi:hypothetical protein